MSQIQCNSFYLFLLLSFFSLISSGYLCFYFSLFKGRWGNSRMLSGSANAGYIYTHSLLLKKTNNQNKAFFVLWVTMKYTNAWKKTTLFDRSLYHSSIQICIRIFNISMLANFEYILHKKKK